MSRAIRALGEIKRSDHRFGELLYDNPLASADEVADFRLEGEAAVSFPRGRLRLENALDPRLGQESNFVFWCPEEFPADIAVSWDFWPIREPGLCILFFGARGHRGLDLFDPSLAERTGPYDQYHHGDLDAYHVSYFRRWMFPEAEQGMHLANLRKSHGFHLVAQGADPLPSVANAWPPYRLELLACDAEVEFVINGITSFRWRDDGTVGGPPLGSGRIGFRQMSPLVAEYANLQVHRLHP